MLGFYPLGGDALGGEGIVNASQGLVGVSAAGRLGLSHQTRRASLVVFRLVPSSAI